MWLGESNCKKEWFLSIICQLIKDFNRACRTLAINVCIIRNVSKFRHRALGRSMRASFCFVFECLCYQVLVLLKSIFAGADINPRVPVFKISCRSTTVPVIDLAHTNCLVPMHTEMLVHRKQIWVPFTPSVHMKRLLTGVCWVETSHQGESRCTTNSLLAVGTIELHAGCCKLVNIRGYHMFSITTQFRPQVINCDE